MTYQVDVERAPWFGFRKGRGPRRRIHGPSRRLVVRTRDGGQVVTRIESPDQAGYPELVRQVYYDLASCSASEFLSRWVIRAAKEQPVGPKSSRQDVATA